MHKQWRRKQIFIIEDLLPLVGRHIRVVALWWKRKGRRTERQDVSKHAFVVTIPTIFQETTFGSPTVTEGCAAAGGPLPIGAPIEFIRQPPNFILLLRVLIEIGRGGEHSREKKSRIHGRQLTLPSALSR